MLSPRELEEEVDHSFFDGGFGDGRDEYEKLEGKPKSVSPPTHKGTQTNTTDGLSLTLDGIKHCRQHAEVILSGDAEKDESRCLSKTESGSASCVSLVASPSPSLIYNDKDCEADSNLRFEKQSVLFMTLSTDASEIDDKDLSYGSSNETQEEAPPSSPKKTDSRENKRTSKKLIRKRNQSPSSSSSDTSEDTDSGRSSSSNSRSGRSHKPSPHPRIRSQDVAALHTEESEDTVTDVDPVYSPNISPLESLDLSDTEVEEEQQQKRESEPSSGRSTIIQDEEFNPELDQCSFITESQLSDRLVNHCPRGKNRKNYSFTNDEVRRIDLENQRLLRALSQNSTQPRPGGTVGPNSCTANNLSFVRPNHNTINRRREQKRIERDNLAFLKRLNSVKATPGLRRSEQLADYHRYVAPLRPSPSCTAMKEQASRRTPLDSDSSTAVPSSRKPGAARPAWN